MTYGNGNTVAYDYDDLERVKNIYYNNSSSPTYTYTYKGEGTLGQLTDNTNNRTYAYTYDSLGRLNGLTEQFGGIGVQTFSASYDTANRPTNVTYAVSPAWNGALGSNRVYTYTYSASDGSLTSMTGPGASMAYTYDGLKRLMKRVVSSDSSEVITRNYSYLAGSGSNTSPLVSSLTANHGSTNLFSGNYSYDSVGNITAITGSAPASYTYDSQNQLLTEVRDGTTYTYTYDAAGNMLSKTKTSGSGTDTFTYGNAEWRDLLTAYNGNAITYDTVGNPTTWYDGATMTWVNGKRLASISAASGHSALAFTYDADGLRLTKTVGTGSSAVEHKYTWQGGKLIAEYDGTNTLEFFYDESGAPYAFSCNGTIYYYVTNLQGDVIKIVNASGTSLAEYSYNAWGQVISATGTLAAVNPIRYRGYYYDVETGFYYLKSRYYDPEICRFINADGSISTGQGFIGCNVFAYCNNNPVNGYDPSGTWPKLIDDVIEKGKECVQEFRDYLTERKEKEYSGTLVIGIDYLLGFGAGSSGNLGLGIDNNGNIGLVAGMFYGAGMPGVSLTGFVSLSNASSLLALEGSSFSAGGSGGECAVFGGEATIMHDVRKGSTSVAGTFQMGIGVGVPFEVHGQYGESRVVSFNLFDLLIRGCNYVLR